MAGKNEPRKDCFAYDKEKHSCKALKECYCKVENCGFFKTKEQFNDEKAKYGFKS